MGPRLGTFFLFLGFCLIVLFVLSDLGGAANFAYFFLGAVALIGGVLLRWRVPAGQPPPSSGRFRMIKNLRNRGKNKSVPPAQRR